MGFPVYDFRTDIRHLLVTPEIRARFLKIEPNMPASFHSHDLGQEVFLIMSGRCEFTIDGETEILEPGQACIALVDQKHSVAALDNKPVVMYLSVTPHILPTHTFWNDDGSKKPPRFSPHPAYDVEIDRSVSDDALLSWQVDAAKKVASLAQTRADVHAHEAAAYRAAIGRNDLEAATAARTAMWDALSALHSQLFAMDAIWNELSPRLIEEREGA
jgi:quercetin dioxygenase-like cupin family protein